MAYRALDAECLGKPDLAKAENLLQQSLELKPTVYYRWIELGNILVQRGEREEAVRAYENARSNAPPKDPIVADIGKQILRVTKEDLKSVPRLRNPVLE